MNGDDTPNEKECNKMNAELIVTEEWKMIKEAAQELGLKPGKLSRLVMQGRIKSKINPRDERQRLVDMIELRKMYSE